VWLNPLLIRPEWAPCPHHTEARTILSTNNLNYAEIHVDQVCNILALKGIIGEKSLKLTEPLLSSNPNLNYPNTTVRFFLGDAEDKPEYVENARMYYDKIQSKKEIFWNIPNTGYRIYNFDNGVNHLLASILRGQ